MNEISAAYDRVLASPTPLCGACGLPLAVRLSGGERVVENEMGILLAGGYGSFIDTALRTEGAYAYILCEACAARLCRSLGLVAPMREHHTSTICDCPDRPPRDARGFPLPCGHTNCAVS